MDSDRPTSTSTSESGDIEQYLSYRVTLGIERYGEVERLISKHCGEYLIYPHIGDSDIPNPHYHILIPTKDPKLSDRIKVAFSREFDQKGNGFHSSKYHTNGLLSGVSYCIHDKTSTPRFKGEYWEALLRNATPFVKSERAPTVVKRVRLGEGVLTLGNLLKQASIYRDKHSITSRSLYYIIDRMTNDCWVPSRDLVTNGVPEEFYELWDSRTKPNNNNNARKDWAMPHVRSERKKEWTDLSRPTLSRFND